jgi:chaperonin GroES
MDQMRKTLSLETIMNRPNLCDLIDPEDLHRITAEVNEGYEADVESRSMWEDRQAEGNKLALQVYEEKTFPWPGAASVKFPLITVAALQYYSRAYATLCSGTELVKCRVIGEDPDGSKADRARRLSAHMSWQNLEQDEHWEEDQAKTLLVQGIAGVALKKRVFEPGPAKQLTMLVLPQDFVINYYTRNLTDSQRYTHRFYLNHNNIRQRELDGRFRKFDGPMAEPEADATDENIVTEAKDERTGVTPPPQDRVTPFFTGEQYCWMDLDGDGYQEPYIITFDINSQQVRRIVARFMPSGVRNLGGKVWQPGDDVYKITPVRVFTKYGFIPSPDGAFYDLGLGSILGPINATINDAINQMLNAGTMATIGGGFLGRGFKNKGGPLTFQPGQWYPMDAPGDDLRKQIVPLPVPQQTDILFKLLGLLLQYGERIVSATDIQVGENIGQNTPAATAATLDQNGRHVYNAIYKGTWRSERDEFRIQYELNSLHLQDTEDFEDLTTGKGAIIRPDDYQSSSQDVRPAADPHTTSENQATKLAGDMVKMSMSLPGWNRYKVQRNWLRVNKVPNADEFLPAPKKPDQQDPKKMVPADDYPPPPNPKMMAAQLEQQKFQYEQVRDKTERQERVLELQGKMKKNHAEIIKLMAQAQKAMAEAKGVDVDQQLKAIELHIKTLEAGNDDIMQLIEIMQKGSGNGGDSGNDGSGMAAMGAGSADKGGGGIPKSNGAGTAGRMAQPGV